MGAARGPRAGDVGRVRAARRSEARGSARGASLLTDEPHKVPSGFLGQPLAPPAFLLVLAQQGSARWLKAELAREHPNLRNAYSRPGVYTFKADAPLGEDFGLRSVFARHWAFSLGSFPTADALLESLRDWRGPLRLFVGTREAGNPVADEHAGRTRAALLAATPELFRSDEAPQHGDLVLSVIVGVEPEETWLVGVHRHTGERILAGDVSPALLPEGAPSRAYGKLDEALRWSGLAPEPGDSAVEIGCAPGGAVALLLSRGVNVAGIDPGEMAPDLARWSRDAKFRHLRMPVGAVKRAELPGRVRFLLCDANLAPQVALHYIEQLVPQLRPHLGALIFTIKLNDERVVTDLPSLLSSLARLGGSAPRAVQLPSHRREIVAVVQFDAN